MRTFGKTLSLWFALLVLMSAVVGTSFAQRSTFASPILVVNTSFLNVRTGPGVQFPVLVTVVGGTELSVLGVANDNVWYQVATDGGAGWVNIEFTLARGDFSNVPLANFDASEVNTPASGGSSANTSGRTSTSFAFGATVNNADVRAQPSYDGFIVRALFSAPDTVYPVVGVTTSQGIQWIQVNIPSLGAVWTDKATPRPLVCNNESVLVLNTDAPIRFDGIANRQSFLLPRGTEVYGIDVRESATIVQLSDGTRGLIESSQLFARTGVTSVCDGIGSVATDSVNLGQGGGADVSAPVVTGNRVVVNTGFLNVRIAPGAQFSVLATVAGGTQLAVLGRAADGVWLYVEGDFGRGWLNNQFVLFRGNYDSVPVIEDFRALIPASAADQQANQASLGQGGGAESSSVTSGRRVSGITLTGDWYERPDTNSLKVRSAVSDTNTIYPLIGVTNVAGITWYQASVPGVGNVWGFQGQLRPLQCGNDSILVLTRDDSIRFDGITNRQSFLLPRGTEVFAQALRDSFLVVQLADGTVGLITQDALAARPAEIRSVCETVTSTPSEQNSAPSVNNNTTTAPTGNRIVVNTGSLNVRSGPGSAFSPVTTVSGGTQLAVLGVAPDGVWYLVQGPFGEGWVNSEFVVFRGNYSTVPVIPY